MARVLRDIGRFATLLAIGLGLEVRLQAEDPDATDRVPLLLAQKAVQKKKKGATKPAAPTPAAETKAPEMPAAATGGTALKFSRDIAPILVANCTGCHNPERRRGKFDLTTFEKLMAGSDVEKVIVAGKPDESHLVLRIRGDESPKMPQGNNNNLSDEAISRIESWVKAGALLDAGIDRKALLTTYATTPEQLRIAELKKMPAAERDKMVETVALKRWKQASPKSTPEVTPGTHFLLFSTLPKERATAALKGVESAYTQLRGLLSKPGATQPALDWGQKPSLLVFNDVNSLVEFVRTEENREIELTERGSANFGANEPYVAVVDPHGGREESPTGPSGIRKGTRPRRGEDDSSGGEQSVAGLLAEFLAVGVLKNEKNAPNWLCLGVGAHYAATLDPRCAYVQKIRAAAVANLNQGWTRQASDALGGELKSDDIRAIGFAIIDWMTHDNQARRLYPAFVRGLLDEGGSKIDDVLQNVYGARRQDLLSYTEAWVAARYRSIR